MEMLKDLLRVHKEVKAVYFNAKGDYLCYPRPGFDRMMTREEVMAGESNSAPKEETIENENPAA